MTHKPPNSHCHKQQQQNDQRHHIQLQKADAPALGFARPVQLCFQLLPNLIRGALVQFGFVVLEKIKQIRHGYKNTGERGLVSSGYAFFKQKFFQLFLCQNKLALAGIDADAQQIRNFLVFHTF